MKVRFVNYLMLAFLFAFCITVSSAQEASAALTQAQIQAAESAAGEVIKAGGNIDASAQAAVEAAIKAGATPLDAAEAAAAGVTTAAIAAWATPVETSEAEAIKIAEDAASAATTAAIAAGGRPVAAVAAAAAEGATQAAIAAGVKPAGVREAASRSAASATYAALALRSKKLGEVGEAEGYSSEEEREKKATPGEPEAFSEEDAGTLTGFEGLPGDPVSPITDVATASPI